MKSFAWLRARPRALASAAVVTAVALTVGYFAYAYEGKPTTEVDLNADGYQVFQLMPIITLGGIRD